MPVPSRFDSSGGDGGSGGAIPPIPNANSWILRDNWNQETQSYEEGTIGWGPVPNDSFAVTGLQMVFAPSNLILVGSIVANPPFTTSYTHAPDDAQATNNFAHDTPKDISGSPTSWQFIGGFNFANRAAVLNVGVTAHFEGLPGALGIQVRPTNNLLFGASSTPAATQDEADALAGAGGERLVLSALNQSFTVNAGAGEYIEVMFPDADGPLDFQVGVLVGGSTDLGTFDYTNEAGFVETYRTLRSTNPSLGNTTVKLVRPA
jgi:hypothetical protein